MKVARKKRPFGDVDVTSFADLAFLLIIFFILTTTLTKPTGARVTIPSGTTDREQKSEREAPSIHLSRDSILLDEKSITIPELRRRLMEMKLSELPENERFVVVESTGDVPFQPYFEIVTAIARAGGILALVEESPGSKGGETEGVPDAGAAGDAAPAEEAAP